MQKPALAGLVLGMAIAFQGQAQTLFTYGGHPVDKKEFVRVYQKNSLNKKPDFSEAALREYLDLYSLFRMKVYEAEKQHLDTVVSIQRELDNYRRQLARNYLTDEQVTNRLVREAYDRSKEEVKVAHILVRIQQGQDAVDTLTSYRLIDSVYKLASQKKADFSALAKQFSEDPGSKNNGGELGYITALQTIYPFENVVYSTPVGKVSAPFKTQFGYHIVKVLDRRPARGEVQVAHILAMSPKSRGEKGLAAARLKIDSARAELKKGVPFEQVVKKYSEDKLTLEEGGVMAPFGVGRMVPSFEKAAFDLKKPGDISEPVVTDYGVHLIKLIGKSPVKPFDSVAEQIKKRVDNDARSQIARDQYFERVKQKYNFKEYPQNLQAITDRLAKLPDTGKDANMFKASDFKGMNQPMFTLSGTAYTQSDFIGFAENLTRGRLMGNKAGVMKDIYSMYVTNVVNDFQEHNLVNENPDFKNLMTEYRDGILLFELMDRNVWGKASRDSVGLAAFYEPRKNKYMWEPGFKGAEYRFKDEATLNRGLKLLAKKGVKDEDVMKELNTEAAPDAVSIQRGRYEYSKFTDVPRADIGNGKPGKAVKNEDGSYTVVIADQTFDQPAPKSLDDARGYAVAEYQDYLEKEWNAKLRSTYPVKVDEAVFRSTVSK